MQTGARRAAPRAVANFREVVVGAQRRGEREALKEEIDPATGQKAEACGRASIKAVKRSFPIVRNLQGSRVKKN